MAKLGTKIYCPFCKSFEVCRSTSLLSVEKTRERRFCNSDYPDVAWFRRARNCLSCNNTFATAEIDEDLLEELVDLRDKLRKHHQEFVLKIRKEKPWVFSGANIPKVIAEEFIEKSAWWHTHSSGSPVRAPKHSKNIYASRHGWTLDFGANKFLVGAAITRALIPIKKFIDQYESGDFPDPLHLKNTIQFIIRGAVANYSGDEYSNYYPVTGRDMMFGAQSIDVEDAVSYLIKTTGVSLLIAAP